MKQIVATLVICIFCLSIVPVLGASVSIQTQPIVTLEEGEMVVKGTISTTDATRLNCVVLPKTASKTDIDAVEYVREKVFENGSFNFAFVLGEEALKGKYTVHISGEQCNDLSFDFDYYPYLEISSAIKSAESSTALKIVLENTTNKDVLKFIGIDTGLVTEYNLNMQDIADELYVIVSSENSTIDDCIDEYRKIVSRLLINNKDEGFLQMFDPVYEGIRYSELTSSKQKQWVEERIYDSTPYADSETLQGKYEEFSLIYSVNNAESGKLGVLLDTKSVQLGIDSSGSYTTYKNASHAERTMFLVAFAKMLDDNECANKAEFKEKFISCVSTNLSSDGSFGGGGTGGGGGSSSNVKPSYSTVTTENITNKSFVDGHTFGWAEPYITYLTKEGIISGFDDGTFRPEENITREQFVKLIVSSLELESVECNKVFNDVPNGAWYEEYIKTAYANEIINGISENTFGVGEKITRQDASAIIYRAAMKKNMDVLPIISEYRFSDGDEIASYASEAVYALYHAGIINGIGNDKFAPLDFCTRGQTAKLIYCLITKGE